MYKSTSVSHPSEVQLPIDIPSETDSQRHTEGTPHTHSHERPSDSMIQIFSENIGDTTDPKLLRWLAYLKSEEGRAFFDSFPSPDAWFEKSQSFGFFVNTPERQASTDRWFRQHFPTGTADENEHIIRDIMRDAILEHEHHKEAEYSRSRNADVLHQILEDGKFLAWFDKKFGVAPPSSQRRIFEIVEEVRLAEREKYLTAENNDSISRINDSIGTEHTGSETELAPRVPQTSANTRALSEDVLTVEDILRDEINTQQTGMETLVPTLPVSPELPSRQRLETALREQFSLDRFNRALQTLNQYGPQEGLRRLKDSDPEVAKQIERLLPKRQENSQ